MKPRIDSRNGVIDTDLCASQTGGRYDLVIIASQRLRELKRQHRESGRYITCIDVLLEVQEGKIDNVTYMGKNLR